MAAYSALPVIPVIYIITGVQVAGLFTMVWKLGGQTEQETIFLYLLIGIGIFLLMFGICVGIGSYTTIN